VNEKEARRVLDSGHPTKTTEFLAPEAAERVAKQAMKDT